MQCVNIMALYVIQEDAQLLHRVKLAATELSTLKPIAKVVKPHSTV